MAADPARRLLTADDLLDHDQDGRFELIDGSIVPRDPGRDGTPQMAPNIGHSDAQGALVALLRTQFHDRGGPGRPPGGWWILPEIHILLGAHDVVVPDVTGFRRERSPARPSGFPIALRPDWVCEVVSPSNASLSSTSSDLVVKHRLYRRYEIPHYWIVDPEREVLTVYRLTDAGYLVALEATRGDTVHAEPFEATPFAVGTLFGDDAA